MAVTIVISFDGTDHVANIPLDTIEHSKTLDTAYTFKAKIFDKTRTIPVSLRMDVLITEDGTPVFRGMVMTRRYKPLASGGRDIYVTGVDYRRALDEKFLGAPDQTGIEPDPDTAGNYSIVDLTAHTSGTDKTTVADLFTNYVDVAGVTFNADAFVIEYVPNEYLGSHPIYWNSPISVPGALNDLAAVAGPTLHWWLIPFDAVNIVVVWLKLPVDEEGHIPDDDDVLALAPFQLAQTGADEDTIFDPEDIESGYDGTNAPEIVFVAGRTQSVYTPTGTQIITVYPAGIPDGKPITIVEDVPLLAGGGQGWHPTIDAEGQGGHDIAKRQAIVSSDASSLAERQADGESAIFYGSRERLEITATVTHPTAKLDVGSMKMHVEYPDALGDAIDAWLLVQQVTTRYINGDGHRELKFTLGDPPAIRPTQKRPEKAALTAPNGGASAAPVNVTTPANVIVLVTEAGGASPDSTLPYQAWLANPSSLGVPVKGMVVNWSLAYYRNGVEITEDIPAAWVNDTTLLDRNGHTTNFLAVGATAQHWDQIHPIASIEQP